MYTVRRSGRLYNKRTGNQGNDQDEVIDLTAPEWDDAGEGKGKSTDDDCANVKRAKVPEVKNNMDKINLRNPPRILFRVITQLTRRQKQDVRDIGFGAFLEFKIKDVPKRLAYWLLDKFDAGTRSLNVNGRSIMITPQVVRNLLGVPMGEVHINARNETYFRNPLARQWKAQFGKDLKRHYNTHAGNEIVEKGSSGWMFKINFLIEDDILKLDSCTYIIACLIKTKRSWKRSGFNNGPIVLLLVLYAHSEIPIKICSSDMLNKFEVNVFPIDDGGDTDVGEEAELEVRDEEQVLEEDDVEEDYYSVGVSKDLEGRKKYVSAFLKKAGELVEMADEVLDKGLENNLTDSGFIELKELRNQLFAVPTYCQQPRNNPDEKEEDDPTNFSFHTPVNDGKQFPMTQVYGSPTGYGELQDKVWEEWHYKAEQIPTRLNFDEMDDIDLNVTQPPATQGKVGGDAEDENNIEKDESLLDAIRYYESQETTEDDEFFTPDQTIGVREKESKMSRFRSDSHARTYSNALLDSKAMVPAFSQPKPLNVLLENIPYGRPRRRVVLPEVLCSPYVVREVALICGISSHERRTANCLFSARLPETDIMFKMSHVDGPRSILESLYPGVDIASRAIDLFTHTNDMRGWEYVKASEKFNENMEDVLKNSLYKTLDGVELVFFPVLIGTHFNLMCMNVKECVVQLFDKIVSNVTKVRERYGTLPLVMGAKFLDYMSHVNHPKHDKMSKASFMMMTMGCNTKNNFVDCGVFVMCHMETLKGDVDCCGFSKEGEEQIEELKDLRNKYIAKILLADCNEVKREFERETKEFKKLPLKERMRLENDAFKKITARVKQMMK
ncbi:ulp1 protease family, C-terminal catalytic domain-containing protein [Tanacetum coccineum]|uniref:Ulp1 protease family, C-terminal catalytic domain-containing protein n=1 Tax=Tanacetum coccineum TaxID=301880 RepID=A0ABQ5A3P6_9ASTR